MDIVKKWIKEILPQGEDEAVASTMPEEKKSEDLILAELLQENMWVKAVPDSMLINISYRSTNPEFARLVTDAIAEAYKDETMAIQLNSTDYALSWMTQKAEEERKRLVESEKELQAFMKKHDIITIEDRVAILPQQLTELTTRLVEAQNKTTEIQNLYNQVLEIQKNKGDFESLSIIADQAGNADALQRNPHSQAENPRAESEVWSQTPVDDRKKKRVGGFAAPTAA